MISSAPVVVRQWAHGSPTKRCALIFVSYWLAFVSPLIRTKDVVGASPRVTSDNAALLRMLEAKLRANYERIETWSGTYRLKTKTQVHSIPNVRDADSADESAAREIRRKPGQFLMERQVLVRYAVDMRQNRLFTTYEAVGPDRYTNLQTGTTQLIEFIPVRRRHIITSEHWIRSIPSSADRNVGPKLASGPGISSAVRRHPEGSERFMVFSLIVDPRRLFGVGKTLFFDRLGLYVAALDRGSPCPIDIIEEPSETGVIYTLRGEYRMGGPESKEEPIIVEFVFHPSVDYNVVLRKTIGVGGNAEEVEEWEYGLFSGIHLPTRHLLTKYRPDSNDLWLRRELVSLDTHVNEPLADGVFTWNSAGLQDGDEIKDAIEGKVFRYKNGELVSAAENVDDGPSGTSDRIQPVWRGGLLIGNLALLLAIAISLIVARVHRKSRLRRGA